VRELLDASGAVVKQYRYDSFGVRSVVSGSGAVDEFFAYAGQARDPESGLQQHWHRYYDPPTGRWISADWNGFRAGDSNLYRYVSNSPASATDSSGLDQTFKGAEIEATKSSKDWKNVLKQADLVRIQDEPAEMAVGSGIKVAMTDGRVLDNAIIIEVKTNVPLRNLHFLQFAWVKKYKTVKDKEVEVPGIIGIGRSFGGFYTELGEKGVFVDTNDPGNPLYDVAGPYYKGKTAAGAKFKTAFAIADQPGLGPDELKKTDGKEFDKVVFFFETFLMDIATPLYRIHWKATFELKEGKWGPATYEVLAGELSNFPAIATAKTNPFIKELIKEDKIPAPYANKDLSRRLDPFPNPIKASSRVDGK
jgi:RHS repeat-associated protein